MKLYDKKQIDWNSLLFDNRALFLLLLPIVVEQLLNSLMGMVDTMMVSTVGSEAISAVSLVDSINNLVIQIFSAMASGAVILCSQYIGGALDAAFPRFLYGRDFLLSAQTKADYRCERLSENPSGHAVDCENYGNRNTVRN